MESLFGSAKPAEVAPKVYKKDILKEGYLEKRSRYWKSWRRRYVVLMKTHMLTFKENTNDYTSPTEVIPINNCCTVKSADDELNIKNTFVSKSEIFLNYTIQKVLVADTTFYF